MISNIKWQKENMYNGLIEKKINIDRKHIYDYSTIQLFSKIFLQQIFIDICFYSQHGDN